MTLARPVSSPRLWRYPHGHRFTATEMRNVMDAIHSYAYRWGLRAISPFHAVQRATHAPHSDSGYNGWTLVHAELRPARHLAALADARGGAHLAHWWALRAAGFRPVCPDSTRLTFTANSVPLDYVHAIETLPIRRGVAAISRWTWCRGCDAELAVTRLGWCASCALAPVSGSADDVRPIGAPLDYRPEVGP